MVGLLEELKSVPGVVGAFVFDSRRGTLANAMPSLFRPEKIDRIGRSVAKIQAAGQMAFPAASSVLLAFDEALLTVLRLDGDAALVVMSTPAASHGLVAMSVKLILPELTVAAQAGGGAARAPEPQSPPPEAPRPLSPAELLQSPDFGPVLAAFEKALAKAIGPIAKVVLADGLKAWARSEAPTLPGLSRLVEVLAREIKDPARVAAFRQAADPLVASHT